MTMPPGDMPPPIDDEMLSAWVDGALSDAEREAVTAAMARDPALRERARDLRATVALLRALPRPMPRRTFILTPEMIAPVRPVRPTWFTRFFPTMAVVSAVAAVLCFALFLGDVRTNGFRATTRPASRSTSRAIPETVATNAVVAPAAPLPAATAATNSASGGAVSGVPTSVAAAGSAASAPAPGGQPAAAVRPAATGTPGATTATTIVVTAIPTATNAPTATAPSVLPTAAAVDRPPDATANNTVSTGGATVAPPAQRRVPLALVRTGEIALLLLFLVGLGFAIAGWRAKHHT
jgi:hypothetical protein